MTARPKYPKVDVLVDELFDMVERPQGYSFCSDGETFSTVPKFFERIRGRYEWSKEASRQMRKFLRKHGQLKGPM